MIQKNKKRVLVSGMESLYILLRTLGLILKMMESLKRVLGH
jgi:hypothetical protein